jgi:hypothetical protein
MSKTTPIRRLKLSKKRKLGPKIKVDYRKEYKQFDKAAQKYLRELYYADPGLMGYLQSQRKINLAKRKKKVRKGTSKRRR